MEDLDQTKTVFSHRGLSIKLVSTDVVHKMVGRIANREDLDQTASPDPSLCCLSMFGRQLVFELKNSKHDRP